MSVTETSERTASLRNEATQPALARIAAERACVIRFADIPPEVVAVAKTHILDRLGVGLAAATLPRNRPLAALVSALGAGGNSTALGFAGPRARRCGGATQRGAHALARI
jgi:2-methylcitrate dehydratase PrpD